MGIDNGDGRGEGVIDQPDKRLLYNSFTILLNLQNE